MLTFKSKRRQLKMKNYFNKLLNAFVNIPNISISFHFNVQKYSFCFFLHTNLNSQREFSRFSSFFLNYFGISKIPLCMAATTLSKITLNYLCQLSTRNFFLRYTILFFPFYHKIKRV